MDRIQDREPLSVVLPKVSVETLVSIDSPEFPNDLDG
jgi:hypothetical protein